MDDGWYGIGAAITGFVVFLGTWAYCAMTYGFLGFAIGWLPAMIVAWICAFLWPLIALVILVIVILVIAAITK